MYVNYVIKSFLLTLILKLT